MLYVTLLDQFHPGIYSSQVIDVCDYLNEKHKAKIRIVAFLSIRELRRSDAKKKLKALSPTAIVLPSFPGLKNFQLTSVLLFFVCLFTGERVAICRNVFSATMALKVKRTGLLKKVVLDGRSAMTAEIKEYDVFPVDFLRNNVAIFEKKAVNDCDFRMAVSEELINYWRRNFNYKGSEHVVIPCTLDRKHFNDEKFEISENSLLLKKNLGFNEEDIILVYSGSTAPWQSFGLLEKMMKPLFENDPRIKILFLSKENSDNKKLQQQYPGRVAIKWLEHKEVPDYLHFCDYGILVREQSETNKVASPTKFAEYLCAGLKVLISDNLGDFSAFVTTNNCGYVITENAKEWPGIKKVDLASKIKCFELSVAHFRKESPANESAYKKLLASLQTS